MVFHVAICQTPFPFILQVRGEYINVYSLTDFLKRKVFTFLKKMWRVGSFLITKVGRLCSDTCKTVVFLQIKNELYIVRRINQPGGFIPRIVVTCHIICCFLKVWKIFYKFPVTCFADSAFISMFLLTHACTLYGNFSDLRKTKKQYCAIWVPQHENFKYTSNFVDPYRIYFKFF